MTRDTDRDARSIIEALFEYERSLEAFAREFCADMAARVVRELLRGAVQAGQAADRTLGDARSAEFSLSAAHWPALAPISARRAGMPRPGVGYDPKAKPIGHVARRSGRNRRRSWRLQGSSGDVAL